MPRRRLTPDQLAWLATLYPGEDRRIVAHALGLSPKQVTMGARNHGIDKVVRAHRHFEAMDDAWLAALYPDLTAADVAAAIGFSTSAVQQRAGHLGLKKSAEFFERDARGMRGWLS